MTDLHGSPMASTGPIKLKPGRFQCPMCGKLRPYSGSLITHILGARHRVCWRHRRQVRS